MNSFAAEREYHDVVDPHKRGARSAEFIRGAQDGLVNTLGVVLGVAAASMSVHSRTGRDDARATYSAASA